MSVFLRQLNAIGWNRIVRIFIAIWFIILLVTILSMMSSHGNMASETKVTDRLKRVTADLEALRKQNEELQALIKDINFSDLKGDQKEALENFQSRLTKAENFDQQQDIGYVKPKDDPNAQYELLRRRIYSNIQELWYFVNNEVVNLQKKAKDVAPDLVKPLNNILKLGLEHKRSLLHDMQNLEETDGYSMWREREANSLSDLVQSRFRYLQNPTDCSTAKKVVCNLNKGCGYGCQLHHLVYCFTVAYGTQRTLILKSKGWRYHKSGWEEIFQPLSDTCVDDSGETSGHWPATPETQVIVLPIVDSVYPRPPYLPPAIPEDISQRLIKLHGDPIVWWIGQILKYVLRPQPQTTSLLQNAITNTGFQRPIVGVHVRRTDKVGTEAAFHGIDEYMTNVEEYFNQLELKERVDKRRIYLASDDPKVIHEAKKKYSHYEILGDPTISKMAAVQTRYSDSSLQGILVDLHMLSMCDFLVCTFSSQVCRVAYEMMQSYYPDAAARFRSLDDVFYYGGQNAHNHVAVLSHESQRAGEISLMPGDLVGIGGNHWNGYSKGRNLRTNQIGLFPGFKVKDKVETVKCPRYPDGDTFSKPNV